MIEDLENTFSGWGQRPGKTEIEKCENAERIIKKAIDAYPVFKDKPITAFTQGSYKNNTNVKLNSDIDICALYDESQFSGLNDGITREELGLIPASYPYNDYKNDLESALLSYFGAGGVKRCNKHFDIKENSYRIEADVVACINYRRYHRNKEGKIYNHLGTAFITDKGSKIVNWPYQNYDNGVTKNKQTGYRFKKVVRILKKLRDQMIDEKIKGSEGASSFILESILWNVPNSKFNNDTLTLDIRNSLAFLFNNTRSDELCDEWGEINDLKYLFRTDKTGKREKAHSFIDAAWEYLDLE